MQYWDKYGNIYSDNEEKLNFTQRAYNKMLANLDNASNWLNETNPESEAYKQKVNTILGIEGPFIPAIKTFKIAPYLGDIWNGRNLILDRFIKNQDKIKIDGDNFYQNYLQKNPAYIKNYGEVTFSRKNRGKDLTENYLEYPFLRKKLENSNKIKTTNYKNESDRKYDYLKNSDNGDVYNYVIENIDNVGKRYKMMHNKTKGE